MGERDGTLRWRIGEVAVTRVEERVVALPSGSLLPGLTADLADRHRPWVDPFVTPDGRLLLSMHSFVVRSGGATIVIDTCVGAHGERPLPHDPDFLDRLASAVDGGLDAVDVVVCTHLHFDHVGWNTVRDDAGELVPTFPNAHYLVTVAELATNADHDELGIDAVSVEPLRRAGCLRAVESDHRITDEVRLVPTPGHTEGHVSVAITSGGETALVTGDTFHSPLQIPHPELGAVRFDTDSEQATATRHRLIGELADTGALVLGTHFPPPTAGRVVLAPPEAAAATGRAGFVPENGDHR